jgi:flagellum-specific ATP synthase
MPKSADPAFLPVITKARQVMATYADMEELIRLAPTGPAPALRSTRPSASTPPWRRFWPKARRNAPA